MPTLRVGCPMWAHPAWVGRFVSPGNKGRELVENANHGMHVPCVQPLDRTGRVINPELHRVVGILRAARSLMYRVGGFVDQHRDAARNHQSGCIGDLDRHESAQLQPTGYRGHPVFGGTRSVAPSQCSSRIFAQRQIEHGDVTPEFTARAAVGQA